MLRVRSTLLEWDNRCRVFIKHRALALSVSAFSLCLLVPAVGGGQSTPQVFLCRHRPGTGKNMLLSSGRGKKLGDDRTGYRHQFRLICWMAEVCHTESVGQSTFWRKYNPVNSALQEAVRPVAQQVSNIDEYWRVLISLCTRWPYGYRGPVCLWT